MRRHPREVGGVGAQLDVHDPHAVGPREGQEPLDVGHRDLLDAVKAPLDQLLLA